MKMDTTEKLSIGFVILVVILFIGGITGYVKNVIKLIECDFEAPYKTEIIRTVSLFPIVGAFTGYMTIGEEVKEIKTEQIKGE